MRVVAVNTGALTTVAAKRVAVNPASRCLGGLVLVGLALLSTGCATATKPTSDTQAKKAALKAKIERCLEQTGGKLPTLYVNDPLDVPLVRDTPEACRGIELQVQEAVHQRTMTHCAEVTALLGRDQPPLSAEKRQTAERQLRHCVEGHPDIFYW
jgi:hypothetical protein